MRKKTAIYLFIFSTILLAIAGVILAGLYASTSKDKEEIILIANWNMQIFGDKKAGNITLMESYAEIIRRYDVMFLQELRDADNSSFEALCSMLPDHECIISGRAGRSSSKEQYGIVYLRELNVTVIDYSPDEFDRWERPPVKMLLRMENYSLTIFNIHVKPNETTKELRNLEEIIEEEPSAGNIILLGDLNAGCAYAPGPVFDKWHWIIKDSDDTTATNSNCAYDRILMNEDSFKEYYSHGIYRNISKGMSDHYLIWVAVTVKDKNINYKNLIY